MPGAIRIVSHIKSVKMIEVFKTNIQDRGKADIVVLALGQYLGYTKIAIDLDDCDRILRIEADHISSHGVIEVLGWLCCECEVLQD